jgi:hypothetical protein
VDVVAPEQMVGNDRTGGMDNGDDPLQREPLVALDV